MAYLTDQYCDFCEREMRFINGVCVDCADRMEKEKNSAWNALDTDSKLRDIRRRLEKLERGPMKF